MTHQSRHLSKKETRQQEMMIKMSTTTLLLVAILYAVSTSFLVESSRRSCTPKPTCAYVRGQLRVTPFNSECDLCSINIVRAIDGVRYNPTTKQCQTCSEMKSPICGKSSSQSSNLKVFYSPCEIVEAGYMQEVNAVVDKCGKCVKCDHSQVPRCGVDPDTQQVKPYSSECDMYLAGAFPTTRSCNIVNCNRNSGPKCAVDSIGVLQPNAFASECEVLFKGFTVATGGSFVLDQENMKCIGCGDSASDDDKKKQCGVVNNKIVTKPYQNLCDLVKSNAARADGKNGRPTAVVSGTCGECVECNSKNPVPICGISSNDGTVVPYATECDLVQSGAVPVDVTQAYYDLTSKRCVLCTSETNPDAPVCGEVDGIVRSEPFDNLCELKALGGVPAPFSAYDPTYRKCSACEPETNTPVCGLLNGQVQVFENDCAFKAAGASYVSTSAYNPASKKCEQCQSDDGNVCGTLSDGALQIYKSSCARTQAGATEANAVVDSCGKCVTCSKSPVTFCGFDLETLKNVKYNNECAFFASGAYPVPASSCK